MPTADKDIATMFMSFAGHCMGVISLALLALVTLPACELGKAEVAAVRSAPPCRAAAIAAPQLLTPCATTAPRCCLPVPR